MPITLTGSGNELKINGYSASMSRGLAGSAPNWDTLILPGYYSCQATQGTNSPKGSGSHYGTLHVYQTGELALRQEYREDSLAGGAWVRTKYSTTAWVAWTRMYDTGNDGFGSGAEADSVPGYGIGAVIIKSGVNLNTLVMNGIYACQGGCTNAPEGGTNGYGHLIVSQYASSAILQIYCRADSADLLYHRIMAANVWGSWNRIWNSAADGNLGYPPAPKPQAATSVPGGEFISLSSNPTLPAGGTWWALQLSSTGLILGGMGSYSGGSQLTGWGGTWARRIG
jgi:hypothetical protein